MKQRFLGIALFSVSILMVNPLSAQLFGKKKAKDVTKVETTTQQTAQHSHQQPQKGRYTVEGEELPFFRMRTYDDQVIKREDVMNGKKTFLVLFNPTCGSCIELGKTFRNNQVYFKDCNVVFVAGQGMEKYLEYYFEHTQLNEVQGYYVGIDESNLTLDTNVRDGMPQLNIYKPGLILEKIYTGSVPFDYLKKHL